MKTKFRLFTASGALLATTLNMGCALQAQNVAPAAKSSNAKTQTPPATYGAWRSVKMGGGGYIQNVVISPSNPKRLYTYVDVGGVFRSDDGGNRWKMLHGNLPAQAGIYEVRGLLVDPRDDKRVLIAAGSQWNAPLGIYLSSDAGNSWKKVLDARFMGNGDERWTGFILARHPQKPNTILAASEGDGVFRSTDNGNTWQSLGQTGLHSTDIRFDRANPNRVWMCAQPFKGWVDGRDITLNSGFFRSTDGGTTWKKVSETSPTEILQDPKKPAILYGLFNARPHISRDGGDSWQPLENGLPPREAAHSNTSEARFESLGAGPDFILTASTRGTFYRLKSDESAWQKIERQGLEEIYEGEEWFRHKEGGFGSALASITVHPKNPNHWFFTDWYAIYQSFDAGKNWKLTINGIEVTVLHALTQDPVDPGVVHLGMADNGYFWSENGGERFRRAEGISNNVKSISVARSQPSRLYAVGPKTWHWEANQVFVSNNRGRQWTRSPMIGLPDMEKEKRKCNTIVADPKNAFVAYLAVSGDVGPNAGGIYKTEDGGKKWTWIGDGLPAGTGFFRESIWDMGREIAVSPDGSLLCISREQGALYRFDASTQKWQKNEVGAGGSYYSVVADNLQPGRFFLGIRGTGLFRSDDGGKSWKRVLNQSVGHVSTDEMVKNRVAVGTENGVMLSTNGGETWQQLDRNLPYRINPIVAFAGERLLAGTAGNGAFWIPLSAQGAQPIKAKPATEAAMSGRVNAAPPIQNGDMTQGTAAPTGWSNPWAGSGKLEVVRDVSTHRSAPASLKLQSVGGAAYGTVSQSFAAHSGSFTLSGAIKANGKLDESLFAVQAFGEDGRQIGWITVFDARDAKNWTEFSRFVSLPPGTKNWNLVLTLKGDGAAWLDDVKAEAEKSVFLD